MDRPAELAHLTAADWERLQEHAHRFELAWQQASRTTESADLGAHLPPVGDQLRPVLLHELIKLDLEVRWKRGQLVVLDYYLERFPELGSARTLSPQLLYEEYRVRQLYGDKPAASIYQRRFPDQYAEFQRLLQRSSRFGVQAPLAPSRVTPITHEGGYRLVKRIGSGGFGEVWQAEGPGGIPVAIKIISRPLGHEEMQRELQVLDLIKKLRHPHLLATQDFLSHEDRLLIVTELAEGSLRDRLKECRRLGLPGIPVAELVGYHQEAAEAIDYLHSQHVMHRDVKPDNILLLNHQAKVADFGLARIVPTTARSVMEAGSGTPGYMAPEVWRGKMSRHSDQYALAMTYAEMRLERRVFPSRDMAELMFDHLERQPELEALPRPEQEVLLRALAKDSDRRFPSCGDFARALSDAVARETGGRVVPPGISVGGPRGPAPPGPTVYRNENVQFTVYRPRTIEPARWYPLLAFAHLDELPDDAPEDEPDPVDEVKRQAKKLLGKDLRGYRESTHDSRAAVPREGEVTFLPEVPGVEFNPPRRTFLWVENVHREEFRLRAAAELVDQTARGKLSVFLGRILLAEIPLNFRVGREAAASSGEKPAGKISARPYRKIFASYSHRDAAVVEEFERYARALGDTYLRDCTHLRAGEAWTDTLQDMIDQADVFQLFWSWNALHSDFVQREWRYALALNRPNFVRPTYWEDPLPALPEKDLPPEELRRLHFQRLTPGLSLHPREPAAPAHPAKSADDDLMAGSTPDLALPPVADDSEDDVGEWDDESLASALDSGAHTEEGLSLPPESGSHRLPKSLPQPAAPRWRRADRAPASVEKPLNSKRAYAEGKRPNRSLWLLPVLFLLLALAWYLFLRP